MSGEDQAEHVLFEWRVELGRLAALMGAAGLAIAQPLLDAFGKSPETFVFRDVAGTDLVLFALGIVLVPPLVLWSAGLLVGWRAPRWRVFVHGASIGVLVGLAVVQLLAGAAHPVAIVAAALLGLGGWVLTVRAKAFQMWGQLLVCLPVMALVAFLVASPASDLLVDDGFEAAAASGERGARGADRARRAPHRVDHRLVGSDRRGALPQPGPAGVRRDVVPEPHDDVRVHEARGADDLHRPDARRRASSRCSPGIRTTCSVCSPIRTTSSCRRRSRACVRCRCAVLSHEHRGGSGADDGGGSGAQLGALFHDAVDLWVERVAGGSDDPTANLGEFEEEVEAVSASDPTFGSGEAVRRPRVTGPTKRPSRRSGWWTSSTPCNPGRGRWPR